MAKFMLKNHEKIAGLKCVKCGAVFNRQEVKYTCSKCGYIGILDVIYHYPFIGAIKPKQFLAQSKEMSLWRYLFVLPVENKPASLDMQIGWTPLYRAKRMGESIGLKNLYIKDDTRNPTGSLKDRASAIAIALALDQGQNMITAASTGNAASSLAGLAAAAGISTVIFIPKSAPIAKVAQLQVFGANIIMVDGTYDQAFDLCLQVSEKYGWYCRNTAYNPYLSEGKKTVALEIAEQMKFGRIDRVFVPVGDGCIIGGVKKGFYDLKQLGFIPQMPKIYGVQAAGSNVIAEAFFKDTEKIVPRVETPTVADSISVGYPRDAIKALRAVRDSHGSFVVVKDRDILFAQREMASNCGIFAEPAGAVTLAGLKKMAASGDIDAEEKIVILATGSGLKDIDAVRKNLQPPPIIKPNLEAVEILLSSQDKNSFC